ncbi:LytTR family DNA-binding domain-containing protein [Aestuariibaculum sp. YM273]|uniref:LytR/AlgR family response regulator transcription factor n=1 Tax=Aestuariibaculum sp. YM273 TaxID=3070659 RepID=UPI0027DB8C66|nr:LytTR family DNA-binding domain-containing protein [Aestuariibaculum sp. YM273]WMI66937.1 LytTR family DNA-binding domain-containing protein [Aestuariibaculum sp. YM273]
MKQYRTLIIDDEPPARQRLKELLGDFSETFQVVDEACNGEEGIGKIQRLKPDIIFLDIQMPEMNGFEMLQNLQEIPIVVFCTAFDEYALQAFATNSLDYLLKPVRRERLQQTIDKLSFFRQGEQTEQILNLLKGFNGVRTKERQLTSITVKIGKKISFVKLEEIAYFKSTDKYVSIFTVLGEEHITDQSLVTLDAQLPNMFLRIHRSLIINTNMVFEVFTHFNSCYKITMNDKYKTVLKSGRSYQPQIKFWMGI